MQMQLAAVVSAGSRGMPELSLSAGSGQEPILGFEQLLQVISEGAGHTAGRNFLPESAQDTEHSPPEQLEETQTDGALAALLFGMLQQPAPPVAPDAAAVLENRAVEELPPLPMAAGTAVPIAGKAREPQAASPEILQPAASAVSENSQPDGQPKSDVSLREPTPAQRPEHQPVAVAPKVPPASLSPPPEELSRDSHLSVSRQQDLLSNTALSAVSSSADRNGTGSSEDGELIRPGFAVPANPLNPAEAGRLSGRQAVPEVPQPLPAERKADLQAGLKPLPQEGMAIRKPEASGQAEQGETKSGEEQKQAAQSPVFSSAPVSSGSFHTPADQTGAVSLQQSPVMQISGNLIHTLESDKDSLTMTLQPDGLGEVTVRISRGNDGISFSIQTQTAVAHSVLSGQLDELRAQLATSHYQVADLQVNCSGLPGSGTDTGGGQAHYSRQEPKSTGFWSAEPEREAPETELPYRYNRLNYTV